MTIDFREITSLCEAIVKRGTDSPPTTERAYYAHCFFTKAAMHARSIVSLSDASRERNERSDVGAVCILARSIIEVRNAASYLLEHNISKDEAHLRLHLADLNHSVDLLRVNKGLQTSRSDFWSEHSIAHSRAELERNPIFAALNPDHKKHLLRGKSPFQHSRYRGVRPLKHAQESAIYTLLSHSAHAFGLGLSGFAGYGSATPAGTVNAFRIAIQVAQIYLADMAMTYCKFRRRAIGKLPSTESEAIKSGAESTVLLKIFNEIRASSAL